MATYKNIIIGVNIVGIAIYYFVYYHLYNSREGFLQDAFTRQLEPPEEDIYNQHYTPSIVDPVFEVHTIGCQIPKLDPFDPSARLYFKKTGKLDCPMSPRIVTANRTHLLFNDAISSNIYGGNISCSYKRIWRNGEGHTDDSFGIDYVGRQFSDSVKIDADFVRVECVLAKNQSIAFEDYFPFVPVKKEIEEECANNYDQWVKETKDIVIERLNVVILGIDSISRLNMLRHLTKTYALLVEKFKAIDLHGFNKVGDNTFLNIVPMLSGLHAEECWNETFKKHSLNYLNLIWKDFKQRGYRTFYSEDAYGLAPFNYLKSGFFYQPTDYYYRPLNAALDKSLTLKKSKQFCLFNRTEYEFYVGWLMDYLQVFRDKPHFAFLFNGMLTHGGFNNPAHVDDIYYDFLQKFYDSGFINDTALIVFSDHGLRFGEFRQTYMGKLEERLPFFFLILPLWFKNKYPQMWKNLRINEHRLTTPFDVYETLKDLINFTGEIRRFNSSNRGISLFSENYSERTCDDAAIRPHWCTCRVSKSVAVNDNKVKEAANHLLLTLNNLLAEEINCSKLYLSEILDARVSVTNDNILQYRRSSDDVLAKNVEYGERSKGLFHYILTMKTAPGNGIIEGTVRYREEKRNFDAAGDVSRIDRIGYRKPCTENLKLSKLCVCKNIL